MKHNIWEFVRKPDGSYAISHNEELLADSIPEKWFATQICEEYGFCGQESMYICAEVGRSGICKVDLNASENPFRVSPDERNRLLAEVDFLLAIVCRTIID